MKLKDYKQQMKERMGWKWYLVKLQLLFDFEHQYDMYLINKQIRMMRQLEALAEKIRVRFGD